VTFSDPDGDRWLLKELTERLPGPVWTAAPEVLPDPQRETSEHDGAIADWHDPSGGRDGRHPNAAFDVQTESRGSRMSTTAAPSAAASSITEAEVHEIQRANATDRTPVVFIHGLWLLPSSWARWAEVFERAGFAPLTPAWPDDPRTVEEANANPGVFAGKSVGQVAHHIEAIIRALDRKPAVVGHSFGGLIAQIIAGHGLSAASVAIDPAPFRGVLPLPISALRSASPVLRNPANRGRAVPLTFNQFRFGWGNALDETEARELYDTYSVPAPGAPLFQAATANLNPWTEAKVDTQNPDRGPLLIISGEKDHTVPWAIANASFKRQRRNPGVTEIVEIPGRGHALTIDSGWRSVAETALAFVRRFV
jgi:non-heme chloroperoxidase